jgi:CDP-diacylglycerol--glycerol-3-phosphate 3-phosphatidyltransferase
MSRTHGVVPERAAQATRGGLAPIARFLVRVGVSANAVTVVGLLLTLAGAAYVVAGQPTVAVILLLAGTLSDTLDGAVARAAGGGTPAGAFLDSTLDRVSDAVLAAAAFVLGAEQENTLLFVGGLVLLVGSFLVSYIRAKAETLGLGATVGFAPREARIAIYVVGVAAWAATGTQTLFAAAIGVAALLAAFTAVQRLVHVMGALNERGS